MNGESKAKKIKKQGMNGVVKRIEQYATQLLIIMLFLGIIFIIVGILSNTSEHSKQFMLSLGEALLIAGLIGLTYERITRKGLSEDIDISINKALDKRTNRGIREIIRECIKDEKLANELEKYVIKPCIVGLKGISDESVNSFTNYQDKILLLPPEGKDNGKGIGKLILKTSYTKKIQESDKLEFACIRVKKDNGKIKSPLTDRDKQKYELWYELESDNKKIELEKIFKVRDVKFGGIKLEESKKMTKSDDVYVKTFYHPEGEEIKDKSDVDISYTVEVVILKGPYYYSDFPYPCHDVHLYFTDTIPEHRGKIRIEFQDEFVPTRSMEIERVTTRDIWGSEKEYNKYIKDVKEPTTYHVHLRRYVLPKQKIRFEWDSS